MYKILVLNPGSTSTKVALFEDEQMLSQSVVCHSKGELSQFGNINDQKELRLAIAENFLLKESVEPATLSAVVGRGGLVKPIDGGTYAVTEKMLLDLQSTAIAQHASSLGGILAAEIGKKHGVPSFVVDPVVVDEMDPRAKMSGLPGIERRSIFHALNQKAVARKYAKEQSKTYHDVRVIVAHMGGGTSVGAHQFGRVIDVNDGLDGEGPFSPERSGGLPVGQVVRMCYSGHYTEKEIIDRVVKNGGMLAYIGTNDGRECERMIKEGNEHALLVFESMAYQVSKEIGAMAVTLEGKVDAILLTGGLAFNDRFTGWIRRNVSFIAPIYVYPGENEMQALAEGALRILKGEEQLKEY